MVGLDSGFESRPRYRGRPSHRAVRSPAKGRLRPRGPSARAAFVVKGLRARGSNVVPISPGANGGLARHSRCMAKRSYGSGRLFVRADSAGRETWYGSWRVGWRRIKRRLGPKRRPSMADGLTRTQAEAELRRL